MSFFWSNRNVRRTFSAFTFLALFSTNIEGEQDSQRLHASTLQQVVPQTFEETSLLGVDKCLGLRLRGVLFPELSGDI